MATRKNAEVSLWLTTAKQMEQGLASSRSRNPPSPGGGVGGARHQYVQLLVSQIARNLGYGAQIEEQIHGTRKRIDVAIHGRSFKVACEVPVSTKYVELGNVRKCLVAGYDHVVSVALDRETLLVVQRSVVPALSPQETEKVHFFFPEELQAFLEGLVEKPEERREIHPGGESFIQGRRVRTSFRQLSSAEMKEKVGVVTKVLVASMRRQQQ